MPPPPPPAQQQQQQTTPAGRSRARRVAHRTRDGCVAVFANTLCSVLLAVLLVAGVALFVAWLGLRPHRPRFTLASLAITGPVPGGQVAFNVSDRNPNRHVGIYYEGATRASLFFYDALVASGPAFAGAWYQPNNTTTYITGPVPGGQVAFNVSDRNPNRHVGIYYEGATRASLFFYDALVASGPAFAGAWYQPNNTTTYIAGVLDVVGPRTADASWPAFSEALRAGRLPLRLQLTTAIRFRVNVFHSGRQRMHVNCDLLVGADGNLLPESVGAPCDRYF